ncbi:response regulator [Candidatus Riflebacteria bacterium]
MGKILVVEDEENTRELLNMILEDSYDILTAENGQAAVDIVEKNSQEIKLVILDLMMPKLNGFEAFKKIKKINEKIKIMILAVTADWNKVPGSDFQMSKPFNLENFKKVVNKLFNENVCSLS